MYKKRKTNIQTEIPIDTLMPPEMIMHKVMAIASGMILPAILIPIVSLTGFSEVVEEISKAFIVGAVILQIPKLGQRFAWGFGFGLAFGLSESIFYLIRIFDIGNYDVFISRLYITVPMHIVTALILVLFGSLGHKKRYLIVGLMFSIAIHLAFNYLIQI